MMNNFNEMNNKMSSWGQVSEELNKLEQTPSNEVWVRIQQKKIRKVLLPITEHTYHVHYLGRYNGQFISSLSVERKKSPIKSLFKFTNKVESNFRIILL